MDYSVLEKIGLTRSESKVFLALLDLGNSSVGKITKKSGVASSKTYELLDKLSVKGLISTYKEDKVTYYKAVNPKRLFDYLEDNESELKKSKTELSNIMPALEYKYKSSLKETEVELFKGYKSVESIFKDMIATLNKGEKFLVVGGGDKPTGNPRTKLFFERIHSLRSKKGIILKIIFSELRRKYLKELTLFPHTLCRYLPYGIPSTINIYGDTTILLVMSPSPAAIRIKDANITNSYKRYFDEMWKIGNK